MDSDFMRTAIVTGSARRVGRAVAESLITHQWKVLIHARDSSRARKACEDAKAVSWIGADLEKPESIAKIAAKAQDIFEGKLDLLVNSASSFERVDHWDCGEADSWTRAMTVNARAPYFLTQSLLPMLKNAQGLVVNISDRSPHEYWTRFPFHAASKAALECLTLTGAKALKAHGVRMITIAPGTILVPDDWDEKRIRAEQTRRDIGSPKELVRLIRNLVDDKSRTGEIIML